jgi:hypothetical protein
MAMACLGLALTLSAPARAQDAAYDHVANWLFELYLNRSIQLSVFNANQMRPGADRVLAPQMPAIAKILERHRARFVAAILPPLQLHIPAQDIAKLQTATKSEPVQLDETARTRLIEVDGEFRREQQAVIRSLTADLNVVIGEALSQARPSQ